MSAASSAQALLDALPQGTLEIDARGLFVQASRGLHRLLGYGDGELVGSEAARLLPDPEHRQAFQRYLEEVVVRQPVPAPFYGLCAGKDGRLLHLRFDWDYRRDADGRLLGIVALAQDIGDQAQTAEAAQREREFLASLLETANALWVVLDRDGRIVQFNQACQQVTGYRFEEMAGRPVWDLIPAGERADARAVFGDLAGTGQASCHDNHWLGRDGRLHLISWSNSVWRNRAGEVEFIAAIGIDLTERRRSEANLLAILDAVTDGIMVGSPDGRLVLVNPAICRMLGYTEAELLRLTTRDIHPADTLPRMAEHFARMAQGEFETARDMAMRRKDGSTFLADIDVTPFNLDGRPHILGLFRDVTRAHAADAALQRSRQMLEEAQRLAHVGSWELDLSTGALTWSQEIFRIFEIDPEGFGASYETFLGLVHPDDRELVDRAYRESVANHAPYDYVHRLLMPDGRIKHVNERGQTYYAADGTPLRSLGSVQDITAQRRVEAALRERENEVRLLLDSTAEAIYGIDNDGHCLFVNPACLRLLGYDQAEELLGRSIHGLIHHSHGDGRPYPEQDCPAYAAFRDGRPTHVDNEVFWRKDGSSFPVEYWSRPIVKDGQVAGAVVTFFDISARRQADIRLRQAAAVFENTMEGILITDPEGRLVAVNRAFSQMTGYAEAELLGERPNLLRSGRHTPEFYADMWATIRTTGHWQGEIWNRRKDGDVYAQLLAISAVHDDNGQVTHYVGVSSDISRMKQFEARLEHLAHYDALTDLPNRLLLQSRLEHALDRARRDGHALAVLFFDLDRFKNVNDTFGHPAGDALLQAFADRLQSRIREDDTIARLGGDEFVVVLERLQSPDQAAHVAQNVLDLMADAFTLPSGHEVYVGSSIGIALFPDDGQGADELLKQADAAMYLAKEQGRGTYRFYTRELTDAANQRLHIETELRQALRRDELVLHYQPLHGSRGELIGLEVLVRWHHPDEGMIPPSRFIPVAEDSGLIVDLGEWVLRHACAQAAAWRRAGWQPPPLSINLSPRQFRQADLVERIVAILAETSYDPGRLELEITEGALMDETGKVEARLGQLRALGIRLAIDDFGTGYSSLAYLKRFPVDRLKIDQSFVRDIPGDSSDKEIAATIIAMGRNLRLEVLAEGVETEAQLEFLREQGCQLFQGYLFNRPLPAEAVPALCSAPA